MATGGENKQMSNRPKSQKAKKDKVPKKDNMGAKKEKKIGKLNMLRAKYISPR